MVSHYGPKRRRRRRRLRRRRRKRLVAHDFTLFNYIRHAIQFMAAE